MRRVWVRGAGIRSGLLNEEMVCAGICGRGSANVLVLVNPEGGGCAITSDLLALPAEEEEEETVLVFFVSPVHGCC